MAFIGVLAFMGTLIFFICMVIIGSVVTSALCGITLLITNLTLQRNTEQKRMIVFPIIFLVCGFTIFVSFILMIVLSATAV